MTVIEDPEYLQYSLAGALILWLGRLIVTWMKTSTAARRAQVDRLSALERKSRLLSESLHDHRNVMLKSGHWTRDTLPPFIKEQS